jgi:hypothetical protein
MVSFSIANTVKMAARLVGCAALLGLTTAASCEGDGYVETLDVVEPGQCFLQNPVTNPHPAAGTVGDVLQLANANDVNNDFIRCRLVEALQNGTSVNVIVLVSPQDARGHSFVDSGQPAKIVNLSRQ